MSAKKIKKNINILPGEHNISAASFRFVKWLTTTGRLVIIITELIVVGAFLSRFYLDRQNSDLSDALRQQKAILDSVKTFEKDFANTQKRLSMIKDVKSQTPNFEDHLKSITKNIPQDIVVQQITLDVSEKNPGDINATLNINAYQESALIKFIRLMIQDKTFTNFTISSIQKLPKTSYYTIALQLTIPTKKDNAPAKK